MIETLQSLNHVLGLGSILVIIATVVLVTDLATRRILAPYVSEWGLFVACMATIASVVLSLVYSEYFGIIPCGLCWLGRVALYPQAILSGTALFSHDKKFMPLYGIILSVFGLIVGAYQHFIQMGGGEFIACPVSGGDCARRFFFEFDFMTLPLVSVILFAFLIVLYVYLRTIHTQNE